MRFTAQTFLRTVGLNLVFCFTNAVHAQNASSANAAHVNSEILSPKKVMSLVEQRSVKNLESRVRLLLSEYSFFQVDGIYKWKIASEFGFDRDRTPSTSNTSFLQTDKYVSTVTLSRNFLTGTLMNLQWVQTDANSQFSTPTAPDSRYNSNILLLSVEQLLYPNFLGSADRAYYNSYSKEYEAQRIQSQIDLEDQKVEVLSLFWNAFNARATYEESRRTVNSYENLAKSVRRKNSYAFTAPGDLQQALVEYETRKQNLRDDEVSFQKALQTLKDYLGLAPSAQVELIPENWQGFPKPFSGSISSLKRFQYQQNKSLAADALKDYTKDRSAVQVSLVGKYGRSGLEPYFQESLKELNKESQDRSYIGVKLSYIFNNESARSEIDLRRAQAALENTRLERKSSDLDEQIRIAYDKLNSAKENIQVTQTVLELREKVVQEQNRTFSQGRTDISILIDSMNKLTTARLNIDRARGEFQTLLLQYLYLTDQSEAQIVKTEIPPEKQRL